MAITFDAALGSTTTNVSGVATVTTGAAAAAGSLVVVCVSWFQAVATMAVTVGGTTATIDKQVNNASEHFVIASLVVAGGLASSSQIVATGGASVAGYLVSACSYLGTGGVDTTSSNTTTGTGFSSGSATNALADSLFVGGAGSECAATSVGGTNTNGTPRFDIWNAPFQQGMRMLDLITTSIGAQALTGTWANTSTATTGALVIYKGVTAASGIPDLIAAPFHR